MKIFRRILLIILIVILVVGSVCYINGKKLYDTRISEISLDDKVEALKEDEDYVYLSQLPDYYKNAVVAVEDHRFYDHGTVDIIALGRAIYTNIKNWDLREGGSTITQQTAKNLYFIEDTDVVSRKVAEVILGNELEKKYSKDQILELYMNTIYFGDGYYGVKEACEGYLGKEPQDMTLYDATMLAGIPNAPSAYAPTANFEYTCSRQRKVVSSMVEYGYLSEDEANDLYKQIDEATYPIENN